MRFHKLDLNLLVALDALLTERSITRAAEKLFLSQSAMSNALSRLRGHFDDELLVQVGRKMEITPRADALQEAVRDVLVRIEASIDMQPQFDCRQSDREFTLFVSDYSVDTLIPHALSLASRQHSTVRFRLLPQVRSPARSLERGEADLLIIPKEYCSPDHPTEPLFTEDFVCTVWTQSAIARDGLSLERYTSAGHVDALMPDSALQTFLQGFMQQCGITRRVEVGAYSFASQPFLVVGTELIATVHSRLARLLFPALPLTIFPLPMQMPKLHQSMQWHKYRSTDPALVWLRKLIRDAATAMDAQTKGATPGQS